MIDFQIYTILVTKWKYGIVINDIIIFNEELDILSTSNIDLFNIYVSSHEEEIVFFNK